MKLVDNGYVVLLLMAVVCVTTFGADDDVDGDDDAVVDDAAVALVPVVVAYVDDNYKHPEEYAVDTLCDAVVVADAVVDVMVIGRVLLLLLYPFRNNSNVLRMIPNYSANYLRWVCVVGLAWAILWLVVLV